MKNQGISPKIQRRMPLFLSGYRSAEAGDLAGIGQGDKILIRNDDVVIQLDIHGVQGLGNAVCGIQIGLRGESHAARMVVGQSDTGLPG